MKKKVQVVVGTIEETLLLPLWGRAYEMQKKNPRLIDSKAVEIIEQVDYDFSTIEKSQAMSQYSWVARSLHFDRLASDFIQRHPEGTIVNMGCGLDTTFERVDNGKIMFYELDLPNVIQLRQLFFDDSPRHICISSSFLDIEWFEKIEVRDGLLLLAGGVLMYFEAQQIKTFLIHAADYFKSYDLYFDALSPFVIKMAKRQVLKKGGMGMSLEGGWGLKSPKELENWDDRITLVSAIPILKGMKGGMPFHHRLLATISDLLRAALMVHLRVDGNATKT